MFSMKLFCGIKERPSWPLCTEVLEQTMKHIAVSCLLVEYWTYNIQVMGSNLAQIINKGP